MSGGPPGLIPDISRLQLSTNFPFLIRSFTTAICRTKPGSATVCGLARNGSETNPAGSTAMIQQCPAIQFRIDLYSMI